MQGRKENGGKNRRIEGRKKGKQKQGRRKQKGLIRKVKESNDKNKRIFILEKGECDTLLSFFIFFPFLLLLTLFLSSIFFVLFLVFLFIAVFFFLVVCTKGEVKEQVDTRQVDTRDYPRAPTYSSG